MIIINLKRIYEYTKFINDGGESRQIWKCIGTSINGLVAAHVNARMKPVRSAHISV